MDRARESDLVFCLFGGLLAKLGPVDQRRFIETLYLESDAFVERQLTHRQGPMDSEHSRAQQHRVPSSLDEFQAWYRRDEAIRRAYTSGG